MLCIRQAKPHSAAAVLPAESAVTRRTAMTGHGVTEVRVGGGT